MPKVSVIVPVYNVSQYIETCAMSLFAQTLDDMELIFINDLSPDDSVNIIMRSLRHFPQREDQVRIINMPANSGSAGARRKGIIEATGEYIIQLDGDDWVDPEYYRTLYETAVKHNADIVIGDEVMEYPKSTIFQDNSALPTSGKEIMHIWYRHTIAMFCHNKLVRRTLYTDNGILPWKGLNMWEDNGLFARLFYHANNVVQVHGPVYHYNRCNGGAMTSGYGIRQVNQMIAIAGNLDRFFSSKPDAKDYEKTVNAFKYLAKINLITDSFANYRKFRSIFPECDGIAKELDPKAFSCRGRFRFYMVRFGFAKAFILMFKIKNTLRMWPNLFMSKHNDA